MPRTGSRAPLLAGWTIGSISQYESGPLLGAPASNNSIGTYLPGQATRQFRVPGVPLYLKNLNCGCIDPTQETVLNPAAWVDQAAGVFGTGTVYYSDFRGQRRPVESMSLGKRFPIRETHDAQHPGGVLQPVQPHGSGVGSQHGQPVEPAHAVQRSC